ncbi:MAG: efflux RND transporter periplasmic adaptor subunit [Acidobacteriales bacterium]|nr:efflux RND transporter periplasmic adaptor subunit [Terriglobales bacterium]
MRADGRPRSYYFFLISIPVLLAVGCTSKNSSNDAPGGKGKGGGGAVPITIAKVVQRDVPIEIQVVGNVEAYSTITVKSQVTGQLLTARFREGDYVKAGELLFTIDRRPLDAQIREAEATLAKNLAQAKQAEANLAKDQAQQIYLRAQADRYSKLTQEGIISKDQNDMMQANYGAINQSIEADRAAIESARADAGATRANIENLKVQLSYTAIKSPISGRTGNLNVKEGNLVTANTTELMTINQVQPIYVTFAVPEARLADIKQHMAGGHIEVFVTGQDGNPAPERGVVTFVDNSVDTTTGTIKVKATLPNADRRLWPGQFVRVTVRLATRGNAALVPNQAVQTGQEGAYVYVVKQDNTVESRRVVTSIRVDQDLVVDQGLTPGETVVLEGQLRLAPGMKVTVRDPSKLPSGATRRPKS